MLNRRHTKNEKIIILLKSKAFRLLKNAKVELNIKDPSYLEYDLYAEGFFPSTTVYHFLKSPKQSQQYCFFRKTFWIAF